VMCAVVICLYLSQRRCSARYSARSRDRFWTSTRRTSGKCIHAVNML